MATAPLRLDAARRPPSRGAGPVHLARTGRRPLYRISTVCGPDGDRSITTVRAAAALHLPVIRSRGTPRAAGCPGPCRPATNPRAALASGTLAAGPGLDEAR